MTGERSLPAATVQRLPAYLQALLQRSDAGDKTLSSDRLAEASGVNSAKLRKDLSYLGAFGTRGVGYDVAELITEISRVLGVAIERNVVLVGAGNLGRALASYGGFDRRGFRLAAAVDTDPRAVGQSVGGLAVEQAADLARIVAREGITVAILTIPAANAQAAADQVVAAGVTAILNFAPASLDVPDGVTVRTVDLSTELQILSFYAPRAATLGAPPGPGYAP